MAKTLTQIEQQIHKLQMQAEALKAKEVPGVIKRIKEAIAHYGLTAAEIFGPDAPASAKVAKAPPAPTAAKGKKSKGVVRYRDNTGRTWTGMGPKPQWLQAALAAGQSLDAFKVSGGRLRAVVNAKAESASDASSAPKKTPLPAKYKDDAGHSWTGRGPTPRWLQEAIASGKTLEQMAA